MNKKTITTIIISVAIFVLAVALLYRYLIPPSKGSGVQVTIPHPVNPNFNQEEIDTLKKTKFYDVNIKPTTYNTINSKSTIALSAREISAQIRS